VDTRGDGGQIIVAPSRNVHGPYRWAPGGAPWEQPPVAAPPALLEELLEKHILVLPSARSTPVPAVPAPPQPVRDRLPAAVLLEKYLAHAGPGRRNTCGFHLALQLRDNGYSLAEAAAWMLRYQQALDVPANRYTAAEALDSLRSAYQRPPRRAWDRPAAPVPPLPDGADPHEPERPEGVPSGP
jgi:hypothetical protein